MGSVDGDIVGSFEGIVVGSGVGTPAENVGERVGDDVGTKLIHFKGYALENPTVYVKTEKAKSFALKASIVPRNNFLH